MLVHVAYRLLMQGRNTMLRQRAPRTQQSVCLALPQTLEASITLAACRRISSSILRMPRSSVI